MEGILLVCSSEKGRAYLAELLRQMADQWNRNAWGKVWVCCCWGLLGWHVICGVIFLITNLTQGSYFSR